MKFLLIAFALMGIAAAAQLPDSATQGPNPQDIATPEPEYIDIDVPEPAPAPAQASAPAPRIFSPAPISRPLISAAAAPVPQRAFSIPVPFQQNFPGHTFSRQSGYQYRRPVYIRRVYRHRRY